MLWLGTVLLASTPFSSVSSTNGSLDSRLLLPELCVNIPLGTPCGRLGTAVGSPVFSPSVPYRNGERGWGFSAGNGEFRLLEIFLPTW